MTALKWIAGAIAAVAVLGLAWTSPRWEWTLMAVVSAWFCSQAIHMLAKSHRLDKTAYFLAAIWFFALIVASVKVALLLP